MADSNIDSSLRQLALIANRLCDSHKKDRDALHRMLRIILNLLGTVKPTLKEREELIRVFEKCAWEDCPELEYLTDKGAKHVMFFHGHLDVNVLAKHMAWGDVVEDINMEVRSDVTHTSMEG